MAETVEALTARVAELEAGQHATVAEEVARILASGDANLDVAHVRTREATVCASGTGPSISMKIIGDKTAIIGVVGDGNLAEIRADGESATVKARTGDGEEAMATFLEAAHPCGEEAYAGMFLSRLGNIAATLTADDDEDSTPCLTGTTLTRKTDGAGVEDGEVVRLVEMDGRLTHLERWRADMATKVVTGEVEARSVTVNAPDGTARIYLMAADDWATISVMAKDSDEAPAVTLNAMLEDVDEAGNAVPEAFMAARTADKDVAWLGYSGHVPERTASFALWGPNGKTVVELPGKPSDGDAP